MRLSLTNKTLFGTLLAVCLFLLPSAASATHYQYGHINWQPGAGINEIEFTIQNAWCRSAYTTGNRRCIDPTSPTLAWKNCSGLDGFASVGDVTLEQQRNTLFDPDVTTPSPQSIYAVSEQFRGISQWGSRFIQYGPEFFF